MWDREDYFAEAEKQLSDKNVYGEVTLKSYRATLKQVMMFLKVWKERER